MKTVFVATDSREDGVLCVAATMEGAIRQIINHITAAGYTCTKFRNNGNVAEIGYNNTFRVGLEIIDYDGEIIIIEEPIFEE